MLLCLIITLLLTTSKAPATYVWGDLGSAYVCHSLPMSSAHDVLLSSKPAASVRICHHTFSFHFLFLIQMGYVGYSDNRDSYVSNFLPMSYIHLPYTQYVLQEFMKRAVISKLGELLYPTSVPWSPGRGGHL